MNEILSYLELHIGVIYICCTVFINILCVLLLFLNKFKKKYENIIFVNIVVFIIYSFIFFIPYYGMFEHDIITMILLIYILCFLFLKILRIIIVSTYKSIKKQEYTHEAISKKIKIFVLICSLLPLIVFTPRYIYESNLIHQKNNTLVYKASTEDFLPNDKYYILTNNQMKELKLIKLGNKLNNFKLVPYEEYNLSLELNTFTTNDNELIIPKNETELRKIGEELLKKQSKSMTVTNIRYQVFDNGYIMVSIYNIEYTGLFGVYGYVDNYSIYKDCKYIDSVEQSISNMYEIK